MWTGWSAAFELINGLLARNAILYPAMIVSVVFAWDVRCGQSSKRRRAKSWSGAGADSVSPQ